MADQSPKVPVTEEGIMVIDVFPAQPGDPATKIHAGSGDQLRIIDPRPFTISQVVHLGTSLEIDSRILFGGRIESGHSEAVALPEPIGTKQGFTTPSLRADAPRGLFMVVWVPTSPVATDPPGPHIEIDH
jgi:hypothetical protein